MGRKGGRKGEAAEKKRRQGGRQERSGDNRKYNKETRKTRLFFALKEEELG